MKKNNGLLKVEFCIYSMSKSRGRWFSTGMTSMISGSQDIFCLVIPPGVVILVKDRCADSKIFIEKTEVELGLKTG